MKSNAVIQLMKYSEILILFSKLSRLNKKLSDFGGKGTGWSYTFDDGTTTKYTIHKFRDFESIQDDVENYFLWLWNLKDYLKSISKNKQMIEDFVNNDINLKVSGDIANRLKHSTLRESRSGLFPKLGKLKVTISQNNIAKITFYKDEVEIDPKEANDAELSLPVYDCNENEIIDSFELIRIAEKEWDKLFQQVKVV
ncbi:MAG: hypothetical protein NTX22_00625 [Ignavibacteriales bacterium]|nr:hypothetical protein [Ignavibacteriales bacterium]